MSPSGRGTTKTGKHGRGRGRGKSWKDGELLAIPLADQAPAVPLVGEHHGNQRTLDNYDSHLDEDTMPTSDGFDPTFKGPGLPAGNLGRLLLDLIIVRGEPQYRVVDGADRARSPRERLIAERSAQSLHVLGSVLVEHEAEAIRAPNAQEGRQRLALFTSVQLTELSRGHSDTDPDLTLDRSLLSRRKEDRIGFPWGEVKLKEILGDNPGDVDLSDLADGWEATVRLCDAEPDITKNELARQLAARWARTENTTGPYAHDFLILLRNADRIWGAGETAKDADHLRAVMEDEGFVLNRKWLYRVVRNGILQHPAALR